MSAEVTTEIPKGQCNRYEVDHEAGKVCPDHYLFTLIVYSADYGLIDGTLGEDGDPLDVLVILPEPVFPGVIVKVRPLGAFKMISEADGDDKLLCVPDDVRSDHYQDINDISQFTKSEIGHSFIHYKDLESGKEVSGSGQGGKTEARRILTEAIERHK